MTSETIREQFAGLSARIREQYSRDEWPLRSELFSTDQMVQHGKALASSHNLSGERTPDQLLKRLAENEDVLLGVRNLTAEAVKSNRRITPAAEWLLDNFYLIEEQIRTAKRHLPKGYSRQLPRLADGPSAGLPRVYDLALETISHGDGRVDPESLSSFIAAYQTAAVLKLGELWALPIMLRLALIENLRRVASRIAADRLDRNRADHWADLMTETAEKDPKSLILVIADMARSNPPMVSSFVAELARRLQGQGPALALPLTWIEQRLSESGSTIQQMVQEESQQQAADQVSISNSIGSLRFLGAMDWREFVERMSAVERILREDIGGVYGQMDFATRDRYRHAVEKIARSTRLSESDVAQAAIQLARDFVSGNGGSRRAAHVGFYLIDKGTPRLEQVVGSRRRIGHPYPLAMYLGAILLISAALTGGLLIQGHAGGLRDWALVAIGALSLLCMSQLAVAIVNWLATLLVQPHPLPRMDFSTGIPPQCRTLVVVPSMLIGDRNIEELVEALEVRFLANQDDHLHFGLLTDFRDADQEKLPEDEPLLNLARQRIEELNVKYPRSKSSAFFLFHRPRRWDARDKIWMGYERKRGKLGDLNALLRGESGNTRFSRVIGDTAILESVKYVITLDTDTQLPRDSARQFAGAMAHPLNQPWYDKQKERITEGYGILQPRVAVSLPGTSRSRYARLWGSEPGIDPYTRAVSDVYQDLFGEGSFIGKGIYEVDAFEQALRDRFPDNRILSHDLLEGCYARAGLLSDVQLYEEYPSHYSADVSRRHRWIRGDWQLVRWLFPAVPGPDGRTRKNPLSVLSRWKLFDNLRRSLVPPGLTLLLLLAWSVLPEPWNWTWGVLGIILAPALIASVLDLLRKPGDVRLSQHLSSAWRFAERSFAQAGFTLVCLPYEAAYTLDAILRTAVRMLITHKRLLEWNPSGDSGLPGRNNLAAAPLIACAAVIGIAWYRPGSFEMAAPMLALWLASPVVAWWISRPLTRREARLSPDQTVFLRKLSRKTWAFFETFAGPEDHWLPPDNFQEQPAALLAHRTSPTNMGLSLLANLSAYDFGYISAGQLIDRTCNALQTMEALERHRGHFYNWYDTQSLKPLPPAYISSVDSGNLSGHLLTLRPGLLELPDREILGGRLFDGLGDTLAIVVEAAAGAASTSLTRLEQELTAACVSRPPTVAAMRICLLGLSVSAANAILALDASSKSDASGWARAFARQCQDSLDDLAFLLPPPAEMPEGIPTLRQLANLDRDSETRQRAQSRIAAIERLAERASELARMEYDFLFDKGRRLLAIGYNVGERRCDPSYYDLLASEARLCTFVAIAQGQLPQESWFALGRLLTTAHAGPVLLSWSGSMFEYLMPLLVMPSYSSTLLDQTCIAAVETQIEYGRKRGVPWGISESGYNAVDVHLNYQYRAFGVPGLGLKRGLGEDLVIAPYASALALMVAPEKACANLQRLAEHGLGGKFGLYEAVDYTSSRLPRGQASATVHSFMAHHQGMSLLSLAHLLLDRPMQRRFESDPLFQATTLLLQERIPKATAVYTHTSELSSPHLASSVPERPIRVLNAPDQPVPEVQLLSNGRYHVMLTSAGGGYSRWKDLAVTRWREDTTRDNWGAFCYLRDLKTGEFWSTAYQPTLQRAENCEAIFSEARAEFRCRNRGFDAHTEIAVSPEDDIEIRRISITNRTQKRRAMEVTSYAEVVLASSAADALHPAFGNLFVQTEIIREQRAILCTRRPRSQDEHVPWMFHLMAIQASEIGEVSYETDRSRFIGRGNTTADPDAMHGAAALSGSEGSVLDPIVAIRYRITLDPEETVTINIVSGVGENRAACLGLVEKYQDRRLADRVFDLAWTHSQVVLRQLNTTDADALLYERLASSVIYANPLLRADPAVLILNRRGQSGLWGYAISGDLPIVLVQIADAANMELVRQLVQAHAYWKLKGLTVDLVIWNEDRAGYRQLLQEQILGLISAGIEAEVRDRPGGIFVRPADQISSEDRILLQSVARVIVSDTRGTLLEQINQRRPVEIAVPRLTPKRTYQAELPSPPTASGHDLLFFNGLGGFTPDGREYIVTTSPGMVTPAPWSNVLANSQFGTVISESGAACTWSENAHEFRLSPWSNDPVSDSSGEAFYIRDEETGHFWSPMPMPCRGVTAYVTRHGFGYSVFEHTESGIRTEVWVYVALDSPVKFTVLKVTNESDQYRKLSVTGYTEWVLGDLRSKTAMHVVTEIDPNSGAMFARNPYNTEFPDRVGFFSVDDANQTVSGDRTEFLGRNGSPRSPKALTRFRLSGKTGGGLDPCAALQVPFELAGGGERSIVFTLGAGQNGDDAANLVNRFRGSEAAREALEAVWQYWKQTLGAVNVETPDQSLNILANGWLMYQVLACRMWARTGYYQPGGAYGFRDQLQDSMALVHAEPGLLREHLLRCASRQFREGDVQHWWHPPTGRGVRTHCSDDFLWLPLAVARYVVSTGDTGVLDEPVHYLDGRPVNADEDSYYDLPVRSLEAASLYDHCVAAIGKGLSLGQHGLPLMGSGDWNDGMNLVGAGGKGESVWLGFFLHRVLTRFTVVARARGDVAFAEQCVQEAAQLSRNIEKNGWDGAWYRRAYFDDGSPLGSAENAECRIDSIAQSWSVLSGAGFPERSGAAMEAVDQRLVRRRDALIQLLDPPFDQSTLNPGYIKGYVPGVRENGGQYTHAAIWTVMAFAALGDSRRAWELFDLINPVNHAKSAEGVDVYKVEPYVVAADVYAVAPHTGRGGWTWYTGSAGWMYRLIVESLLGLRLERDKLYITPCFPQDWESFKVHYRYRETVYHITVLRGQGSTVEAVVPLVDDRRDHTVEITIGVSV